MRYELKMTFPKEKRDWVLECLSESEFGIREIFMQRKVNNIYLDTLNYSDFLGNFHGDAARPKFRIRWYGDSFTNVKNPVLEMKYKQGLLGGKKTMAFPPFRSDETFCWSEVRQTLQKQMRAIPAEEVYLLNEVLARDPVLFSAYERRYFETFSGKCRVTLDWDLVYYNPEIAFAGRDDLFASKDNIVVVEVKCEEDASKDAQKLVNALGFRLTKNSKYVAGVVSTQSGLYDT
jgi:VTC domain.